VWQSLVLEGEQQEKDGGDAEGSLILEDFGAITDFSSEWAGMAL
jgi:hypothetical protein